MASFGEYFKEALENSRLVSSCIIYAALKNPMVKLYYQFLKFVFPKFTNVNKLFQSEMPNIRFLNQFLIVHLQRVFKLLSFSYVH